jgi:hypothetical protein
MPVVIRHIVRADHERCAVSIMSAEASPDIILFQIEPQQSTVDRDYRAGDVARPR